MNVAEFCQKVGTTRDTLRLYDQMGLLKPKRNQNNYRNFSIEDQKTFAIIRNLQKASLTLGEIKMVLELRDKPVTDDCHIDTANFIRTKRIEFQKKRDFYKQLLGVTDEMSNALNNSQTDMEQFINNFGTIE
ncbi:MerR family transcriptional regulator [Companilactobacillus musae]|uniref:MerR family transcriptional regulator n=1 Tax=Companilactobacillus musae TaxID=1903258 RepID=UPI0013C313CD|nr:MerR family transcriptional regulator [Companilactobacillus musae]